MNQHLLLWQLKHLGRPLSCLRLSLKVTVHGTTVCRGAATAAPLISGQDVPSANQNKCIQLAHTHVNPLDVYPVLPDFKGEDVLPILSHVSDDQKALKVGVFSLDAFCP